MRVGADRLRPGPATEAASSGLVGHENLSRWATSAFAGGAAVAAGWYLAGGEARMDDQVGPVAVALIGLVIAVAGHASLVRRMRTHLGIRRESVFGGVASTWLFGEAAERASRPGQLPRADASPADLVTTALPAGRFFHRPACPLIRNKHDVVEGPAGRHAAAGKAPCGVCRP